MKRQTQTIQEIRAQIDKIDERIVKALAHREKLMLKLSGEKKTIFVPSREEEVLHRVGAIAEENRMDPSWVQSMWKKIMAHSRSIQKYELQRKSQKH